MDQFSSETRPLFGTDDRARTLRLFFIALIGTPWLLFLEPTRQIRLFGDDADGDRTGRASRKRDGCQTSRC